MITAYWPSDVQRKKSKHGVSRAWRSLLIALALGYPLVTPAQTQAPTPPTVLSPEGGEEFGPAWLVRLLDRLTPSIDTRLPETGAEIENRLAQQIDAGHYAEALEEIKAREALHSDASTQVQWLFLKARALQGMGEKAAARGIYQQMTTDYPELPEPWNNLAVMQAAAGEYQAAEDSLTMALRLAPNFPAARANLNDLRSLRAQPSSSSHP